MKTNNDHWLLHLSDFHICKPEGNKGFFCKGYFEEFIDRFALKVLERIPTKNLAGVVFTGDIIDKGEVDCLPHAQEVLDCLCGKLGVAKERVIAIHGNHDFVLKTANEQSYSAAIDPVRNFLKQYGNIVEDGQRPFFALHELNDGLYVLGLDSLIGAGRNHGGDPGELSDGQQHDVMECLRRRVKGGDVLIVASHFPLSDFDEDDVRPEKLWRGGRNLAKRISDWRQGSQGANVWLSGDLHLTLKPRAFGRFACLLGCHLDGRPGQRNEQRPGALLVQVRNESTKGSFLGMEIRQGYRKRSTGGEWWLSELMTFGESSKTKPPAPTKPSVVESGKLAFRSESVTKVIPQDLGNLKVETFDDAIERVIEGAPSLEEKVIQTVAREDLYHWGRFEIAEDHVSLGWVSIGPLLVGRQRQSNTPPPSTPLLPLVVSGMRQWLAKKAGQLGVSGDPTEVVLLGIDQWGAIIASQLSIMTGWRNFCIAGRGAGAHHTAFEGVTHRVVREVEQGSLVVFVTDVIATGSTLADVRKKIMDVAKTLHRRNAKRRTKLKWLAVAVLCDANTERGNAVSFLQGVGCACKSLRLPLIPPQSLPDVGILPPTLRFTRPVSEQKKQ